MKPIRSTLMMKYFVQEGKKSIAVHDENHEPMMVNEGTFCQVNNPGSFWETDGIVPLLPPGWSSVVPALAAFVLFFCLLRGLSTLVTAGALRLLADFPGFI